MKRETPRKVRKLDAASDQRHIEPVNTDPIPAFAGRHQNKIHNAAM